LAATALKIGREQVIPAEGTSIGGGGLDLASGRLVDCRVVSETLRRFFQGNREAPSVGGSGGGVGGGGGGGGGGFVLDGFPRTPEQIDLMIASWPESHRVHYCVQLDVPDEVCEQKILGRRECRVCRRSLNVADVQALGFDLPPQIPDRDASRCSCDPGTDWTVREDDDPTIARRRLQTYRDHEAPIVEHYRSRGRLLAVSPRRGELDVPDLQRTVQRWLASFDS
jgi:adenylate kinase family enzyme